MARRRRRSKRYGGIVSLPGFGKLPSLGLPSLKGSVRGMDVLVGGAAGFAATNVLDALLNKFAPEMWTKVKVGAGKLLPLLVSGLAGGALYLAQKKSNQGAGHFFGAVAYGVAGTAQNFLRGVQIPGLGTSFSDVVSLPLGYASYNGLLVDNPAPQMQGYNGLLVDNPAPQRSNLAALGQLSMADDYDGMDALASMG